MAKVQILHDDMTDPTLALDVGLTVQYVEVVTDDTGPHDVVEITGSTEDLERFLEEFDLTDYRIQD